MDPYLVEWLRAFALTQIVEIPIAVALTRGAHAPAYRRAAFAFFATLATHPIVWFVIPVLGVSEPARLVASEAWAFGAELLFYKVAMSELSWRRAAAVSALANTASFGLGLLLWRFRVL